MFAVVNDKTDTASLCGLSWEQMFLIVGCLAKESTTTDKINIRNALDEIIENIDLATEVAIGGKAEPY